jgi:hypothetical protein
MSPQVWSDAGRGCRPGAGVFRAGWSHASVHLRDPVIRSDRPVADPTAMGPLSHRADGTAWYGRAPRMAGRWLAQPPQLWLPEATRRE